MVTESPSTARTRSSGNVSYRRWSHRHSVEVRRLANIGRVRLPPGKRSPVTGKLRPCQLASPSVTGLPVFACGIPSLARLGVLDGGGDFRLRGPDVFEVNRLAGLIRTERVGVEVVADAPGERVSDDERRRHQIICADVNVDAALKVAVATEHADGDEAVVFNGFRNVGGQWTRVADASGAAVTDHVEAQLV